MPHLSAPPLVLASTSPYRRELLARLGLPFITDSPDVDETPLPGEHPDQTSSRLAVAKARTVAARHPGALIIGSDQVAFVDHTQIGKPGNHEKAIEQLRFMRGKTVRFHTALCLLDAASGRTWQRDVPTDVVFRDYSDEEIDRYLRREQPYNCAGSAKSEGLGIAMLAAIRGDDPNALIGLPLIALCEMLREAGVRVV